MNRVTAKQYKKTVVCPFLSKMYAIFKERPDIFVVKKLSSDIQGLCDYGQDKIFVDYRKEFISTLIHEVIHYIYPEWSETKVLREERKIMNSLSPCQIKNIIKRFAEVL